VVPNGRLPTHAVPSEPVVFEAKKLFGPVIENVATDSGVAGALLDVFVILIAPSCWLLVNVQVMSLPDATLNVAVALARSAVAPVVQVNERGPGFAGASRPS
jgi:hypothetical protein